MEDDPVYKATITWINQTTYTDSNALDAITSVNIYRNGTLLTTLSDATSVALGGSVSYIDNSITESGEYTYAIETCDAGGLTSDKTAFTCPWVGPVTPIAIPYSTNFTNTSDNGFWTILSGHTTTANQWKINSGVAECYNKTVESDDWFISRPLIFETTKAYKIKYSVTSDKTEIGRASCSERV